MWFSGKKFEFSKRAVSDLGAVLFAAISLYQIFTKISSNNISNVRKCLEPENKCASECRVFHSITSRKYTFCSYCIFEN